MEKVKIKGLFTLKTFKNGQLIDTYEANNLVVNVGRTAVATFLGAGSARSIAEIAFGTDGTAPSSVDTAITSPFAKAFDAVTYPSPGEVQFDWILETTENNGVTINEFGLLLDNGDLFARKTGASIAKDNTIRLEGSWKIIF